MPLPQYGTQSGDGGGTVTLWLYILIGVGVATHASYTSEECRQSALTLCLVCVFWPALLAAALMEHLTGERGQ